MLQEQGYASVDELNALDEQDPVLFTLMTSYPYAPEYLDMLEQWLKDL
jgi:hypothetical protein